ncbi:MAG TPA: hypothetical protein VLL97_02095, partial [Acidobacteriota bacterium]|nr:hypothetical protein [Acidobacteriota bacterium]
AEPTRFQIPIPEKVSLDWGSSFAVSPDGRHLAFAAAGSDDVVRLWIRGLDSLEARPLPGTESNHIAPFIWSPDSRFIAWATGDKLKKIDIAGGPALTICDLKDFAVGGSWNRDGVIIFAQWGSPILMRVSAAGGTASALTKPDPGLGVTQAYYPTFMPDGRHFLYLQESAIPENHGVYIGSLDAKPEEQGSRRLFSTAFWPCVYVPSRDSGPGQILFKREQTLLAQQFDVRRLELTGEPVPIVEHVGSYSNFGFFSASTNGVLVYRNIDATEKQELVWVDRSGKQLELVGRAAEYGNFSLSPDEKSVVFERTENSNEDIWILDLHRGVTTRLTLDSGEDHIPIWSPDGLRVLWSSNRGGLVSLYTKAATGAGQDELLIKINAPDAWSSDWSRDGKFILYGRPGGKGNDLWVAPLSGDRKLFQYLNNPQFTEEDAVFSSDGRWVAYVSTESDRDEVYVQAFPLTSEKRQISNGGGTDPAWRKDGTELFYLAADRKLMAVPVRSGTTTFEPGLAKALFSIPGSSIRRTYAPSGDGRRFLVAKPVGGATTTPFTVILNWQAGLKK